MLKLLVPLCFALTAAYQHSHHHPEGIQYNYVYAVREPVAGDVGHRWEKRIGDKVTGAYRMIGADGAVRVIDYYSDGKNGLRAVMRREGQPFRPKPFRGLPPQLGFPSGTRDYFGATFVQENNYGRGLGYL